MSTGKTGGRGEIKMGCVIEFVAGFITAFCITMAIRWAELRGD